MPIDFRGHPCDIVEIKRIADKYKLKINSENITYTINQTKHKEIDSKLLFEIRSRLNIIKEDIKKII